MSTKRLSISLVFAMMLMAAGEVRGSSLDDLARLLRDVIRSQWSSSVSHDSGAGRWRADIEAAAARHGLDPCFLQALVECESNGNPSVVSHRGAIGLCQLMPSTAAELGVNPYDPIENLDGGARYIREQLLRFQDVYKALLAYNAGPTRIASGGSVPHESHRFAVNVIRKYRHLKEGGE